MKEITKEQIKLISDALRLNKPVYYKDKYIMFVYIPTLDFKTGLVKVRYPDLNVDYVELMSLEVRNENS